MAQHSRAPSSLTGDTESGLKLYDNVSRLTEWFLPDGPPQIEVPSNAISYDVADSSASAYEDAKAYNTEFTDETKILAEMV